LQWRKIFLSLAHFAPGMDFWLSLPLEDTLDWCVALNDLLEPP
jgi:hypothetical protein